MATPLPPDLEPLVDASAVATALGMTPGAVRKATHRRVLPVIKIGNAARYRLSDVLKTIHEIPAVGSAGSR